MVGEQHTLDQSQLLGRLADRAQADARADFIAKTYAHLAGAILAFVLLETFLLNLPGIEKLVGSMIFGVNGYAWLIVLGAFMLVSHVANKWAVSTTSPATQYLGLGLFIVAEAVIFLPLLYMATHFGGQSVLPTAAIATLSVFFALTAVVFVTRKDFSFLGPALGIAGIGALALIVCSILFGFDLGIFFTVAMIVLAAGYVLYTTSNVLHNYRIGQHVAASLALFASIALMFWYILRLLMLLNRN